jgi:hypothetical protein
VLQESCALSVGRHAMRTLMASAAETEGLDPGRLSFMGRLQALRTRLPEFPSREAARPGWLEAFLAGMARERTDPRRDRINPRVVRIKMSKFKKKRPEHRGIPKLERSFRDAIIPPKPAPQLVAG